MAKEHDPTRDAIRREVGDTSPTVDRQIREALRDATLEWHRALRFELTHEELGFVLANIEHVTTEFRRLLVTPSRAQQTQTTLMLREAREILDSVAARKR